MRTVSREMERKTRKSRVMRICSGEVRIGDQKGWSAKRFTARISRLTRTRTDENRDLHLGTLFSWSKWHASYEEMYWLSFRANGTHPSERDLATIDKKRNLKAFLFLFPVHSSRRKKPVRQSFFFRRRSSDDTVYCHHFSRTNSISREVKWSKFLFSCLENHLLSHERERSVRSEDKANN